MNVKMWKCLFAAKGMWKCDKCGNVLMPVRGGICEHML
jgi:uncharacterized OB-fold protein